MSGLQYETTRLTARGERVGGGAPRVATRHTISTRQPAQAEDVGPANFKQTVTAGVVYGLVGWFHLILCPAYVLSGLVDEHTGSAAAVGTGVWAIVMAATAALMVGVAIGLLGARPTAWRLAPWCVLPNLVAHVVFISVLPVWGAIAIVCDLVALWLVLGERRRQEAAAAGRRGSFAPQDLARTGPRASPLLEKRRAT